MYTIHTVNYSNPSAIEGAIRDATTTSEEAKIKKQEEAQKIKHEVRRSSVESYILWIVEN